MKLNYAPRNAFNVQDTRNIVSFCIFEFTYFRFNSVSRYSIANRVNTEAKSLY